MKLLMLFAVLLLCGCSAEKPTAALSERTPVHLTPYPYYEEEDDPLVYASNPNLNYAQVVVYLWPSGTTNVIARLQSQFPYQNPTCTGALTGDFSAVFYGQTVEGVGSGSFVQTSGTHPEVGTVTGGSFTMELQTDGSYLGSCTTNLQHNFGCGTLTIEAGCPIQVVQVP